MQLELYHVYPLLLFVISWLSPTLTSGFDTRPSIDFSFFSRCTPFHDMFDAISPVMESREEDGRALEKRSSLGNITSPSERNATSFFKVDRRKRQSREKMGIGEFEDLAMLSQLVLLGSISRPEVVPSYNSMRTNGHATFNFILHDLLKLTNVKGLFRQFRAVFSTLDSGSSATGSDNGYPHELNSVPMEVKLLVTGEENCFDPILKSFDAAETTKAGPPLFLLFIGKKLPKSKSSSSDSISVRSSRWSPTASMTEMEEKPQLFLLTPPVVWDKKYRHYLNDLMCYDCASPAKISALTIRQVVAPGNKDASSSEIHLKCLSDVRPIANFAWLINNRLIADIRDKDVALMKALGSAAGTLKRRSSTLSLAGSALDRVFKVTCVVSNSLGSDHKSILFKVPSLRGEGVKPGSMSHSLAFTSNPPSLNVAQQNLSEWIRLDQNFLLQSSIEQSKYANDPEGFRALYGADPATSKSTGCDSILGWMSQNKILLGLALAAFTMFWVLMILLIVKICQKRISKSKQRAHAARMTQAHNQLNGTLQRNEKNCQSPLKQLANGDHYEDTTLKHTSNGLIVTANQSFLSNNNNNSSANNRASVTAELKSRFSQISFTEDKESGGAGEPLLNGETGRSSDQTTPTPTTLTSTAESSNNSTASPPLPPPALPSRGPSSGKSMPTSPFRFFARNSNNPSECSSRNSSSTTKKERMANPAMPRRNGASDSAEHKYRRALSFTRATASASRVPAMQNSYHEDGRKYSTVAQRARIPEPYGNHHPAATLPHRMTCSSYESTPCDEDDDFIPSARLLPAISAASSGADLTENDDDDEARVDESMIPNQLENVVTNGNLHRESGVPLDYVISSESSFGHNGQEPFPAPPNTDPMTSSGAALLLSKKHRPPPPLPPPMPSTALYTGMAPKATFGDGLRDATNGPPLLMPNTPTGSEMESLNVRQPPPYVAQLPTNGHHHHHHYRN